MKRTLNSCLLILLLGLTVSAQEVNDASIIGVLTEGKTVSAGYSAIDTVSPTFGFRWMRIDMDALPDPDTVDLATTEDYTIVSADVGYRLLLRVDLVDLPVYDTAWSAISPVIIANSEPVASNVTITGGLEVGNNIFGNYDYADVDEDPEGTSVFRWVISTAGNFSDTVEIAGATAQSYQIQSSDEDKHFFFGVKPVAQTGVLQGEYHWSSVHGPVITNSAPVASGVSISGGTYVNDALLANYNYSDADNDLEGGTIFRWVESLAGTFADTVEIVGETGQSFQIRSSDQGKYFFVGVKPVAQTGELFGSFSWSGVHGQVNSQPTATGVAIDDTSPEVSDVLTGSYTFDDVDAGELEGISLYRWLRDGTEEIQGETSINYTVTFDDIGSTLSFEVTPVSDGGYPLEGDPAASAATASVPAPGVPVASDVCISGTRLTTEVLTGNYTYTYERNEGISTYKWYRNGVEVGTAINYTLTLADKGATIKFGVTPVSSHQTPVVGLEVLSDSLVTFDILTDNVSVVDDPFTLIAGPPGGVFSGTGVTVDQFDPSSVDPDNSPFYLDYFLTQTFTEHTCVQQVTDTVIVKPIETYFESLKSVYCYDNGEDTIIVRNLPVDASEPTFILTNPLAQTGLLNDTTIVIDPAIFGPGSNIDSIYFSYKRDSSIIVIDKGFVIDSVGTALAFQNLDNQYCTDAAARYISIDNIFPAGGSGIWTGDMLTDKSATSAVLNPGLVAAGNSYPVTYQYKSPHGCYSQVLSESVTINVLPDPEFTIDPTYNLEGPPASLVPVTPGGTFTGPGIVGSDFYPDLAGVGNHDIRYSVTDGNGCYATTTNNTLVRQAEGTIESLPGVICYNDTTYSIIATGLPAGVTTTGFINTKGGITPTAPTDADYCIPDVGAEFDTVKFEYVWDGVDYTISKAVYIDSIGKVEIIGLNDAYCESEGDINLRVVVENSTGTGNFAFSGPDSSFTNYGTIADLYPTKTPPSTTPYTITYTHVSSVYSSGCRKEYSKDVYIHAEPVIDFITDRVTANFDEPPFDLDGSPGDGVFTGSGVYKDGALYKFNPLVAGLGESDISFSYVNSDGCFANLTKTIRVVEAKGSIEGVNANNQYCYDGLKDTLKYVNTTSGWTGISFQGPGIQPLGIEEAIFDPAIAGKGDHTIMYSYLDSVLTRYDLTVQLNVDSIGIVIINNLDTLSEFCNNQSPFELFTNREGGIFAGPVSGNLLVPSSGLGAEDVIYIYTNILSGCAVSVTVPIIIHPAPSVSFLLEDVCIDDSSDTTKFINTSVSDDIIATWSWKFGDPGSYNESNEENPGHLYLTYGPRIVELTAETVNGCVDGLIQTIDLGVRPKADFSWQGDCYLPDDSLHIFSTTTSTTPVSGYSWNFFDGKPPLSGDAVKYPKLAVGTFDAELVVFTNYDGCYDTITKEVFIRPTVVLQSDSYFEDFETGTNGWVPSKDELVNLWSFGSPDRDVINSASSGVNAWYTNFDINNQESGGYSIEGPCFDFTSIERPMIQLDIWKRFDKNRDGVSLQYKLGSSNEWKLLGTLEDGIGWYNSFQINGAPGGIAVGWTSIAEQDTGWMTSRNRLDILKGRQDVRLRLIYASDGTSNSNDGFAFDNIWIGSRSRKVLLEHFTSYFDIADKDANELLNDVVFSSPEDIANIQYHTKFNGADEFYYDNEADISARVLYYGLSQTPYSLVGGGTENEFAYYYDYTGTDNQIDSIDIYKRSMINPGFRIDISSSVAGEVLTISGTVTVLTDLEAENLTLYIAVVEKEVANVSGPNGEELFYNVFKKMIPNSGGIDLKKSWSADDMVDIGEQTWIIENIYDAGDIEIIFFLQNNATREVYQTATTLELDIVTGLFDRIPLKEYNNFMVYPNPASDYITLNFKEEISENGRLDIHNYAGYVVKSVEIPGDVTSVEITDLELPNGLYVLRLYTNGRPAGFRKLIIAGR